MQFLIWAATNIYSHRYLFKFWYSDSKIDIRYLLVSSLLKHFTIFSCSTDKLMSIFSIYMCIASYKL